MFDTGSQPIINALQSAPPKSLKIFVATLTKRTDRSIKLISGVMHMNMTDRNDWNLLAIGQGGMIDR